MQRIGSRIPRHISPHSPRHAAITNALDEAYHSETLRSCARHADPRTIEQHDRVRGNLDRHGVHFLTAVAGVQATTASAGPPMGTQLAQIDALGAHHVVGSSTVGRETTAGLTKGLAVVAWRVDRFLVGGYRKTLSTRCIEAPHQEER